MVRQCAGFIGVLATPACLATDTVFQREKSDGKEKNDHRQKGNVFLKEDDAFHNFPRRGAEQGDGCPRLFSFFHPAPDGRLQEIAFCEVSHEPGVGVIYFQHGRVARIVNTHDSVNRVCFDIRGRHRFFDFFHNRHYQRHERKYEATAVDWEVHDY
jgi:hypothetical protein